MYFLVVACSLLAKCTLFLKNDTNLKNPY